jgi:hypothetical protein
MHVKLGMPLKNTYLSGYVLRGMRHQTFTGSFYAGLAAVFAIKIAFVTICETI